ncbi:MAG: hypothetical protein IPL41_05410 [Micropruina sp.]|nr:hypothetical protein [Micropruina sp.]
MAAVYSDYSRDRVGLFFGLTGVQLGILVGAGAPLLWAINQQRWLLMLMLALLWAMVAVPVTTSFAAR